MRRLLIAALAALVLSVASACTTPAQQEDEEAVTEEPQEETAEEVAQEEETEETTVLTVKVVYVEPVPASSSAEEAPSGLTPEQQENRRIYDERSKAYDGTGPSPWVQGQIDWAIEQGLMPSEANPTAPQTETPIERHKRETNEYRQSTGQNEAGQFVGHEPPFPGY